MDKQQHGRLAEIMLGLTSFLSSLTATTPAPPDNNQRSYSSSVSGNGVGGSRPPLVTRGGSSQPQPNSRGGSSRPPLDIRFINPKEYVSYGPRRSHHKQQQNYRQQTQQQNLQQPVQPSVQHQQQQLRIQTSKRSEQSQQRQQNQLRHQHQKIPSVQQRQQQTHSQNSAQNPDFKDIIRSLFKYVQTQYYMENWVNRTYTSITTNIWNVVDNIRPPCITDKLKDDLHSLAAVFSSGINDRMITHFT